MIVVCAVHTTFPRRVLSCSHGDVVMLFCSSFTQSERFLQTDQLIIRLHSCSHDPLHSLVDEKRVRERVQVRCSDMVGSDLPHRRAQTGHCHDQLVRPQFLNFLSSASFFHDAFHFAFISALCSSLSGFLTATTCEDRPCSGEMHKTGRCAVQSFFFRSLSLIN